MRALPAWLVLVACTHALRAGCEEFWARPVSGGKLILSSFESKVLNEQRRVMIQLPERYPREPDRRYPVVYVLDGSSQAPHTARSAALLARMGFMPELIVVGVPNVRGGRERDYTPPFMRRDHEDPASAPGAGDTFLAFLRSELIPHVEREYRTSGVRMLAGHSRGGLFATYSLLTAPELFAARFVHSAPLWREDAVLVSKLAELLKARPDLEGFLYLSIGSEENENITRAHHAARNVLSATKLPRFRFDADVVAGADHQRNGEMATPLGFAALYRGWRPDAPPAAAKR
jgi:predicted alpha/beta superfamily hydrolase